jgi:hypothetical protein
LQNFLAQKVFLLNSKDKSFVNWKIFLHKKFFLLNSMDKKFVVERIFSVLTKRATLSKNISVQEIFKKDSIIFIKNIFSIFNFLFYNYFLNNELEIA